MWFHKVLPHPSETFLHSGTCDDDARRDVSFKCSELGHAVTHNEAFSQKTFLACPGRKSTGVNNKMSDGWVSFSCSSFQGLGIVHADSHRRHAVTAYWDTWMGVSHRWCYYWHLCSSIMTSQWLVWKKKGPMCSTTRRKSRKINQSALKVSSNTHHSSNNGCFYISGVSRAVEGLLYWMVKAAENTKMKNQVEKQTHFLQPSCLFLSF